MRPYERLVVFFGTRHYGLRCRAGVVRRSSGPGCRMTRSAFGTPTMAGCLTKHEGPSHSLGPAATGHRGRWSFDSAFYRVRGRVAVVGRRLRSCVRSPSAGRTVGISVWDVSSSGHGGRGTRYNGIVSLTPDGRLARLGLRQHDMPGHFGTHSAPSSVVLYRALLASERGEAIEFEVANVDDWAAGRDTVIRDINLQPAR